MRHKVKSMLDTVLVASGVLTHSDVRVVTTWCE